MPSKVVIGAQWGDEGKGKIIDILASRADLVVRAQGGNNAGHTVASGDAVYKLHLIPSGILYEGTLCGIGCGTAVDPGVLLGEIAGLQARGVSCKGLRIDPRAHLIMPWHILLDALEERALGKDKIGTTGCGIGPCYMDKAQRSGLRICDLSDPEVFRRKALLAGEQKNEIITRVYKQPPVDIEAAIAQYLDYGRQLQPYVADVSVLAYEALTAGKQLLFEGAQGTLLDLDLGTYPYVTSSNPISGGVCTGAGIGPTMLDDIIGVAKAYTTRVGEGPFPTELSDALGDKIRERGHEFGTTTGRPRRTGWFDAVILRHAVRVNGLTGLALNKLDTLSGIGPLSVCTAYRLPDGRTLRDFPPSLEELALCEPVYEQLPGYEGDLSSCRSYAQLPAACRAYVEKIEQLCGCRVAMVGVGPEREQNLER